MRWLKMRDEKTGMKESRGACIGCERLDYPAPVWTRVFDNTWLFLMEKPIKNPKTQENQENQ